MKAVSKRGRVFSERFAKTAIKIGIAQEVIEEQPEEVIEEQPEEVLETEKHKKGRKPKK